MSTPITLEDIFQIFQRSQEEADRRAAEWERQLAESRAEAERRAAEAKAEADRRAAEWEHQLAESRAEAERRAAEWERQLAESRAEAERRAAEAKVEAERRAAEAKAEADRRAAEWEHQLAESRAEAERRAAEAKVEAERRAAESKAEADRRAAKWDEEFAVYRAENAVIIKRLDKTLEGLTSRWGRFVENIVAPAVLRLFQEKGFQVQEVYQRVRSARGSRNLEIDILVVDDDVAIVVEVKSRLTQKEVRQVLNTLTHFKAAFPHYGNYRIYGAVAAIEIDKDVDIYAYNQGLFVIKQSGDSVRISNDNEFQPRIW